MNYRMLRGASILLPVLGIVLTVAIYFMMRREAPADPIPEEFIPWIALSGIATFICLVGVLFFVVYDIIHVARRHSLPFGVKIAWACAIFFLSIISIPVYGLVYFRDDGRHAHD
jgi:hypothetical protein